jgi:hypothetical protein
LGQRALAVAPAAALLALVAALGQLIAVLAGFAPAPGALLAVSAIAAAAALGVAAATLVRTSYAAFVRHPAAEPGRGPASPGLRSAGSAATAATREGDAETAPGPRERSERHRAEHRHRRRPAAPPLSPLRVGVVAGSVLVLAIVCWVQPGEPGRVLFSLARALVGMFAYALVLVPLLALVPVPASRRAPVPWAALATAGRNRADLLALGGALASAGRDALLGRAAGIVLVTAALFHLARGEPGLDAGAFRLAGGLLGLVTATPLAGAFSPAGAYGLLLAVLVCVAVVTAGHLHPYAGRYPTVAAMTVLIVVPLVASVVSNRVGYDFYLGVGPGSAGDRVVVFAGLSPSQRHEVFDSGVALADVPTPMRDVLRDGLRVTGKADGLRIAAALVDPAAATADGLRDGGLVLRTGECFGFVGGTSNFRYATPCNGEHTGEVFYVGHLPFDADPGRAVRDAAARGVCEKAYGAYLGAPYGTSYLAMDRPVVQSGGWTPRPLVACLFGAVGPWPLKGTRTVAAMQQQLDWTSGPGCTVEAGLRITAGQPNLVCVAPGKAVTTASAAPLVIDAEYAPVGRAAGGARVGVACVGADAATGYYATVGGDGVLAVTKLADSTRTVLGTSGKPGASTSPSPHTVATQIQLTCRPADAAVRVVATAGKGRQIDVTDPAGVTSLSPRLVVESAQAPVTATVSLFTATVAA